MSPKLSRETYIITRAWFDSAIRSMQEQIDQAVITPATFQPVVNEFKRIVERWVEEQAESGNVR